MSKKTIVVFGATGAQGGGLAQAILNDANTEFSVRAVTRDVNSDKARALAAMGAEVVAGDGTGECGGCTVLVDGKDSICSCLTLAVEVEGRHITTVGGLTRDGELHPIQQAFIDEGAIQCGYCTPGMVMKTASILANNPTPSEDEIRRGLEGNICRCTGYEKIVRAVQRASRMIDNSQLRKAGGMG
jgi:carbon-monoxide dehydrogenase small subunit